jgi:adenylate kinase family enzyme
MTGINQLVKVTLRNPLDYSDQFEYTIEVFDNPLAQDWIVALKEILTSGNLLEKNFCFLGFPETARNLTYLCGELHSVINTINDFFDDYKITETYTPETMRADTKVNHDTMNVLHNHFEILQGTVENLSDYYKRANYETKYAIRQLNNICHEIESLVLSQIKLESTPQWVRPTQITTFLQCRRYALTDEHRQLFVKNGYDRRFGHVYMHWTQIGKTLFEVFRDEHAPELTKTVCEAITELQYYSGEFDIEWGDNVVLDGLQPWHTKEQSRFQEWLLKNNLDPKDTKLSLGYLPLGRVKLDDQIDTILFRSQLSRYLDIYQIEVDGVKNEFNYCWSDSEYKQQQIARMIPGYDYSSRG